MSAAFAVIHYSNPLGRDHYEVTLIFDINGMSYALPIEAASDLAAQQFSSKAAAFKFARDLARPTRCNVRPDVMRHVQHSFIMQRVESEVSK